MAREGRRVYWWNRVWVKMYRALVGRRPYTILISETSFEEDLTMILVACEETHFRRC